MYLFPPDLFNAAPGSDRSRRMSWNTFCPLTLEDRMPLTFSITKIAGCVLCTMRRYSRYRKWRWSSSAL